MQGRRGGAHKATFAGKQGTATTHAHTPVIMQQCVAPTHTPTRPPVAVQQCVPELVGREVEPLEQLALGQRVQDVVGVPAGSTRRYNTGSTAVHIKGHERTARAWSACPGCGRCACRQYKAVQHIAGHQGEAAFSQGFISQHENYLAMCGSCHMRTLHCHDRQLPPPACPPCPSVQAPTTAPTHPPTHSPHCRGHVALAG